MVIKCQKMHHNMINLYIGLAVVVMLCSLTATADSQAAAPYQPIPQNVRPIQQTIDRQQISSGGTRGSTRCYICHWNVFHCTDFNCYNNPDTCTNNNFSPTLVQQADCPAGCEQFVVTDPNGLVQQWRRNCAPGNVPAAGFNCRTEYQLGIRIDRCLCNRDWCNGSYHLESNVIVITVFCLLTTFIIHDLIG